ncbi:MAG: DUF262 domain-containing protein [bacterium]|nr:DUF262 domain-containing protein [bacterium]MBK8130665.1 DUF262 domain-containing protein [bacterium]
MSIIPTDTEAEEIEGLGVNDGSSWGDYPIDTVLIRHETRTVHEVLRRIEQGSFIMDPDFQRDFIWDPDKQSKLIESVLMRIPLPVFYLAEDEQGRMVVVDGLQRLTTFQRFVANSLRLRLPDQEQLNKRTFGELLPKMQNRVEDCNLILYVIDVKVPERARLDIFERVNGGVPLTRQQMRNCLFMGKATRFLKEEAATSLFADATGHSLKAATMRDREFVNRFSAFQLLQPEEYRGDIDEFLAMALRKMNGMTSTDLNELSNALQIGLENNLIVFGKHAFRKHTDAQRDRSVLNAALWDVMSTGLCKYSRDQVETRAGKLRTAFFELMNDDTFMDAITSGTNSTQKVKERFSRADVKFKEALDVNAN